MNASPTTDSDHHYEEIKAQSCIREDGYLTPIPNNETQLKQTCKLDSNESRYVLCEGVSNRNGNPPIKQDNPEKRCLDNNLYENDQTHSLLDDEQTYSNHSQTYLKTPIERTPNRPTNNKKRDALPDALPSTTHEEEQVHGNKRCCCKFSKRNLLTSISLFLNLILVIGLVYFIFKKPGNPPSGCVTMSINSETLRMQTSVCLRCESNNFRDIGISRGIGHNRFFVLHTQDCQKLCCMDNVEHLQWLIKMAEVRIISSRNENNKAHSHHVYNVLTEEKIKESNKDSVGTLMIRSKTRRVPAEYNFQVPKQGVYLIYLFLTVQLNSSHEKHTEVVAKITGKSATGREFVLSQESHTVVGDCRYPISLFRISWLSQGDNVSFSFSHPVHLYRWDSINFSGIVSL